MNLSTLRKMILDLDMSTDAFRYLLRCSGECEYLDYKISLNLDNDYDLASISKDILGMKNVGGGYILVGVQDKTWKPVGLPQSLGLDTKMLRDKVRRAIGLDLDVDIVETQLYLDDTNYHRFALIFVRGSAKQAKRRNPSMSQVGFHPNESWGIRQGDIYIRRGDSTVKPVNFDEITELIENLDDKHQQQDIANADTQPSPFAVELGLYRLLPPDYEAFIGRVNLKEEILKALEHDPRIWIVNLHGPGGVGKTALATYAAYHYFQNRSNDSPFEGILFLSAKERELRASDGIARINPTLFSLENLLENILNLFSHGEYILKPLEERRKIATEILEAYPTLLVLDNMETITDGRIMHFMQNLPPSFTRLKVKYS